jgi:hypothetical protein
MCLEDVVPWGRSLREYNRMFALDEADLARRRILGCADGPASFNAEMHARGVRVVSADPLYAFSRQQIRQRIDETYDKILAGARAGRETYVWREIGSPEELGKVRMAAMERFLDDFELGRAQGRYVGMGLPRLGFGDGEFELAVCSHFLFTYSQQLSAQFHVESVRELCRVAGEVRLFPLLNMDGTPSPHAQVVVEAMRRDGCSADVVQVPYEFQKGGDQMLIVRR